MDPHPQISTATLAERERMVFERTADAAVPIAWALAGGYSFGITMAALVDLHWLTIEAAATPASDLSRRDRT